VNVAMERENRLAARRIRGGSLSAVCCIRGFGLLLSAALLTLAVLGGCAANETPGGAQFEASSGATTAALNVPAGERASIGTYALSIVVRAAGENGDDDVEHITGEREGTVTGLWVDDVTGDDLVDVIVAMTSAGSGSYGDCHVYASTGSGFAPIELAPLDDAHRKGFMGHDTFDVVDGVLYRTFPVYVSGDPNTRPSGGVLGYRYDFGTGAWVEP